MADGRERGEGLVGRLYLIVDHTPASTIEQLQGACARRGVECVLIDAPTFDMVEIEPLEVGAMLYRPATSHVAHIVEQLLVHDGVATFYPDALGVHVILDTQALVLAKHGVPVPRAFYALTTLRGVLRSQVEALGGLPVILKVPGRSLGVGVMRLESWPTLFSVVDAIHAAHGASPTLMACVEPATHWRVIVVGERVAAAYVNVPDLDDFRTSVDEAAAEHFLREPPSEVVDVAVRATAALGVALGGVDVLEHESGRAYVLEVNFPCYFGHPWMAAGIDVAGVMVEYLQARAAALVGASASE